MGFLKHVYFERKSTGSSSANVLFTFSSGVFFPFQDVMKGFQTKLLGEEIPWRPKQTTKSEDWHWNLFDIFLVLTDAWN